MRATQVLSGVRLGCLEEELVSAEARADRAQGGGLAVDTAAGETGEAAMSSAVPLIAMAEDGTMSVPEGTAAMLREIEDPIAIIAVAGPYRSGKSFLMNCLSQEEAQGGGMSRTVKPVFEVGPTVNACTRGLWLHPSQVSLRQPGGGNL
eukprot:COSAG02_NODE_8384_length_2589_cov_11.161086_1_plen_148_part_10